MGRIRAFVQDDIPRVAELFWQFLQGQKGPYPPGLDHYFRRVFFYNPGLTGPLNRSFTRSSNAESSAFSELCPVQCQ